MLHAGKETPFTSKRSLILRQGSGTGLQALTVAPVSSPSCRQLVGHPVLYSSVSLSWDNRHERGSAAPRGAKIHPCLQKQRKDYDQQVAHKLCKISNYNLIC